jgi:hypothetical protein
MLQSLAFLLAHGDYEEAHRYMERYGRQLKAMRGRKPDCGIDLGARRSCT